MVGAQCPRKIADSRLPEKYRASEMRMEIYNLESDHRSLQEVRSTCPKKWKPPQGGLIREAARRSSERRGRSPASTRAPPLSASGSSIVEEQLPMRASPWLPRWPFSHRCRLVWVATPSCCSTRPRAGG